jgi:hypothetical protein
MCGIWTENKHGKLTVMLKERREMKKAALLAFLVAASVLALSLLAAASAVWGS